MKLHNTRTRSTDDFIPLAETVRIYSCGPTVYDNIHIGNLRAFIAADTLRRALSGNGYNVQHVMNLTDIDDKTIARSAETYPDAMPHDALMQLTKHYTDVFMRDMEQIGNDLSALTFTKATDYIDQMIDLILQLHAKGLAYITDDGIYFSIESYRKQHTYGQLSEITAATTSNERIDNDEYDKDAVHDFALWKVQKPGEPAWDITVGDKTIKGRPGWHLECSVMSTGTLGMPFDIHTGGIDLIFPHHENEIAQSTGANGNDVYAQFFVHNEHLLVDGRKMSKSLKNLYTLRDIQEHGYDPLAFRLEVLQSHYRSQSNFSWENLEASRNRLQSYRMMADLRFQLAYDSQSPLTATFFTDSTDKLAKTLANDLDTPETLVLLSGVSDTIKGAHGAVTNEAAEQAFIAFLESVDQMLGLQLLSSNDLEPGHKQRIIERENARANKEWTSADIHRETLYDAGVELSDTPYGTRWYRI